jgi:hypothetical protein
MNEGGAMAKCVLCHEEKAKLTDEHVIYAALGSNIVLPNSTCEECQTLCNKSFEQKFLKGSNFVALIRAKFGIKGRRNEPIYGFDSHGSILTFVPQPGFPPVRVGLSTNTIERPMQVILLDQDMKPLNYHFLPDRISLPITRKFFDEIIESVSEDVKYAAFWIDGNILAVNYWRELVEVFVSWCDSNKLTSMISTSSGEHAKVPFVMDWNTEYRNRGLTKICLMYAMSRIEEQEKRYSSLFEYARQYILYGTQYPSGYWRNSPILQWNGSYPGAEIVGERKFNYFLSTINLSGSLYGLILIAHIGLFGVKLGENDTERVCRNSMTMYLLDISSDQRYPLRVEEFSQEDADKFAKAVSEVNQL